MPAKQIITTGTFSKEDILAFLQEVKDPEIPVISVLELGIVRDVQVDQESVMVEITPTYSGCPAMDVIPVMIRQKLEEKGVSNPIINQTLSPPWTTDWITEEGKEKLRKFGIAPPQGTSTDKAAMLGEEKIVPCPLCSSEDTRLVSQFGSTPCKSAYQCNACLEPFDYFKCH